MWEENVKSRFSEPSDDQEPQFHSDWLETEKILRVNDRTPEITSGSSAVDSTQNRKDLF